MQQLITKGSSVLHTNCNNLRWRQIPTPPPPPINCNLYKLFNSNYIYERPQNFVHCTKIDKGHGCGKGRGRMRRVETFTKCAQQIRQEARVQSTEYRVRVPSTEYQVPNTKYRVPNRVPSIGAIACGIIKRTILGT